jgi:hypothetical protein
LQLNLLDHICCIVEQQLKEDDDFECFYREIIKQFYRKELHEIEEETISLLTFKNYYAMKKLMIMSGILSATAFIVGFFFKIMAWQGTAFFLVIAVGVLSFLFFPLVVLLKIKETSSTRNRLVLVMGAVVVYYIVCLPYLPLCIGWVALPCCLLRLGHLYFCSSLLIFLPAFASRKPG